MDCSDSKRPSYDPEWRSKYADRIASSGDALAAVTPGQRVFVGTGCAQPTELVKALVARAHDLADVEIVHLLTVGEAPYARKELARHFRVNSFFIAENVRDVVQEGLGDYTPIMLSDIPRLFASGQLPLDVALIQVTPPNERGMCSLGISVDVVMAAAENASLLIAQVNPRMPRTHGNSSLHVNDMDVLVPAETPLIEVKQPPPDDTARRIGENIAALVDDGSTMEFGIGGIPHAVMEFLRDKKDLGIHTEMFTDAIIDLVECGCVTGARKSVDQGRVVASFCMGTRELYDYIDGNPTFSFNPTEYVNDTDLIGRQHRMVAINVALEVDLTGQVCADSLGTRFFSGIGGQVDFNRGAARSKGGRAIIALPSTARDGTVSRIVSRLSPGAGVVTSRGDVHYVVTEYGVAYLHGKSIQERAIALAAIAHPDFRAQLLRDAIEFKYVRSEMKDVEGRIVVGPRELKSSFLMDDGTQVAFRPIHPTDVPRMRDLFTTLTRQAKYYRFMRAMDHVPLKQIQEFVFVDHRSDVAIVGTVPEAHGEDIVGVGRYYLDPSTNRAEVAFVVRDEWQSRGIGAFMLRHLISIARRNGIAGFTAEVLRENRAMQAVINKSGYRTRSRVADGVVSFEIEFG